MSDNSTLPAAGDQVRDIDRLGLGVKTQVLQLDFGGGNGNEEQLVTSKNPLPVREASMADLLDVMQQILGKLDPLSDDYIPTSSIELGASEQPFAQDPVSNGAVVLPVQRKIQGILTSATGLGSVLGPFKCDDMQSMTAIYYQSAGSGTIAFELLNPAGVWVSPFGYTMTSSGGTGITQGPYGVGIAGQNTVSFSLAGAQIVRIRCTALVTGPISVIATLSTNPPVNLGGYASCAQIGTWSVTATLAQPLLTLGSNLIASGGVIFSAYSGAVAGGSDAASSARTASGNSGTISDSAGGAIGAVIVVSGVSGTTPTLDIVLQESLDGGTTWDDVWHCERLTAAGTLRVPSLPINGRRRWSWTIGGTTPSFTFAIGPTRGGTHPYPRQMQLIERSLDIATNSASGSLIMNTSGITSASIYARTATIVTSAPSFGIKVAGSLADINGGQGVYTPDGSFVTCAVGATSHLGMTNTKFAYQPYARLATNVGVAANTLTSATICLRGD